MPGFFSSKIFSAARVASWRASPPHQDMRRLISPWAAELSACVSADASPPDAAGAVEPVSAPWPPQDVITASARIQARAASLCKDNRVFTSLPSIFDIYYVYTTNLLCNFIIIRPVAAFNGAIL